MTDTQPPAPGGRPDPPRPAGAGPGAALAVGIGLAVLVVVLALLGAAVLLRSTLSSSGDGDVLGVEVVAPPDDQSYEMPPEPVGPAAPSPVTAGPCTFTPTDAQPARPVDPPSGQDLVTQGAFLATMETSVGRIRFRVDAARTPCAVGSLRSLAEQGYFDGTSCHRLTTDGIWVLQCGDPTGTGAGGPGYEFADEALQGATYPRGTVAMANAGPGTNGSQFFLVYRDTRIPPSYTPLGRVVEGLDLIEEVARAGSDGENSAGDGRPVTPVEISRLVVATG